MEILSISIGILYFALLLVLVFFWLFKKNDSIHNADVLKVSIVIPARNEAHNIKACIQSVAKQKFDLNNVELLIVDDDSSDKTVNRIEEEQRINPALGIKVLQNEKNSAAFKKTAIEIGVKASRHSIVASTDADCTMPQQWLETMLATFDSETCLVAGPVMYTARNGFLNALQRLELSGLIISAAAGIYMNLPQMCNGANLFYKKNEFKRVDGFAGNLNISSGDDTFLLQKFVYKYHLKAQFVASRKAIVSTQPATTWRAFYRQRLRWASKGLKALHPWPVFVAVLTYLANLMLLLEVFRFIFFAANYSLIGPVLKILADFVLLGVASSFFQQQKLLWYFIPQQLFYSIYVCIVGAAAPFISYQWKGRTTR